MVSFFLLLSDLVGEKEQRLRLGLQLMGARGSAYWLSWFIWSVIMNTASNSVLILSGFAFNISFFTNTSIFVLFFLFGSFGLSCVCMAMGCRYHSASVSSVSSASNVSHHFPVLPLSCYLQRYDQQPAHCPNRWIRCCPHWICLSICVAIGIRVRSHRVGPQKCSTSSDTRILQCVDRLVVERRYISLGPYCANGADMVVRPTHAML